MPRGCKRLAGLLVAPLVVGPTRAHADLRSFTHTYEYSTVPEGRTTVELWHTQARTTPAASAPQLYEGILEIEHGVTEHLDVGFYTVLEQIAGAPTGSTGLHLAKAKLEGRYRLAERGDLPVDTLLFLELAKEFGDSVYEVKGKLVGARDFGDLTVAANAIGGFVTGKDVDETTLEVGWAAGLTYQAHPKLRLGIETWGVLERDTAYIDAGPALSFAPSSNLWATLTVGFSITERDAVESTSHGAVSARLIVGIEL
jgi:hypothetical protein